MALVQNRREFAATFAGIACLLHTGASEAEGNADEKRPVYIVPNFHPASCGWLTTFSKERVYCANSYLNHLDRVRDDAEYRFVISEVNNIIAIMNFKPERIPELKQGIAQERVELVNGYFLESAINLAGGEALLRLGAEGIRWYREMFGVTPRFSWNIDVCGTHDQMPQIASELGFEALVYTRKNPTGETIFESVAPDGSKILTFCPGHYSEARQLFDAKSPLSRDDLAKVNAFFDTKEPITPAHAPLLVLAGSGDYALAPAVKTYPSQLLMDWKNANLDRQISFSTLGKYLDKVKAGMAAGEIHIPTSLGGTAYDFDAFWIENPTVKSLFRKNEHTLQAAEILATIASLHRGAPYPAQKLHDAWTLMCLNMDRNTHWGSAAGMVFADSQSWDVQDRFEWIDRTVHTVIDSSGHALQGRGGAGEISLFNPLNWRRTDPFVVQLPEGQSIEGVQCEQLSANAMLCQTELSPVGARSFHVASRPAPAVRAHSEEDDIETRFYSAKTDARNGSLISLRLKANGREILSGPANVIVAERAKQMPRPEDDPGDFMPVREQRKRLATSNEGNSTIKVIDGPIATTVEVSGSFYGGGAIRRVTRFYHDHPRIDFETELNDIPTYTVVVAEFPLADEISEIRRGIPFGFSHGAWSKPNPNLHGWTKGIVPAVRWSHYSLASGGGVALFDRGCSGRETEGRTPIIFLLNAEDKYYGYPNAWLSGKGQHRLEYSLVPHHNDWSTARIPQLAWEYNSPPILLTATESSQASGFVNTSENVIVEAIRREEHHIELRFVECLGIKGLATFELSLPHSAAYLVDALGNRKSDALAGPKYKLPVRPQQIVTVHFETNSGVPPAKPVTSWDAFVPEEKLAALHTYDPNIIGHPPTGS